MARLFISYNRREAPYAFAVRQWLMDEQGWASEDIFVDATGLHSGVEWESKLLTEAEGAEVMLFLASDHSLDIKSFCYRELQHAEGQIIAEPLPPTTLVTTPPNSIAMQTSMMLMQDSLIATKVRTMGRNIPRRAGPTRRILGRFTTCTGMCGSGALMLWILKIPITLVKHG